MGRPLPCNLFIALPPHRRGSVCLFRLSLTGFVFLCFSNTLKAQVIVETFDELVATTVYNSKLGGVSETTQTATFGTNTSTNTISISGTTTATTTSSTTDLSATSSKTVFATSTTFSSSFCTFSTPFTTLTSTQSSTTLGPVDSSKGTYTWYFGASTTKAANRISISSNSTSGSHSSSYYLSIPSQSLVITPTIPQGISTISFWVDASGGTGNIVVGMRTTSTTTNNYAAFPTITTQANTQFNDVISTYTTTDFTTTNTLISPVTYTFLTATSSTYSTSQTISNGHGSAAGPGASASGSGTVTNTYSLFQIIFTVPVSLQGSAGQVAIMADGGTINIDDIEIFKAATPGTWTGTASTDWNNINNWAYLTVPTSTTDVTIPNTTNKPVLTSNASVNSLTLNSSATLGLNAYTLTINGPLTGAGKFISSSSTSPSGLVFGAAATGTVLFTTTPGYLSTLTLDDGAAITLGSSTEIVSTGKVTVGSATGASLTSDGNLILNSDNNGSARVAQVPVSVGPSPPAGTSLSSITGNVQVLTYIHSTNSGISTSLRAWRLLTAPITDYEASPTCTIFNSWQLGGVDGIPGQGTMITAPASVATEGGGNGMDQGINANYSMYTWSPTTQKLVAVANTKGGISGSTGNADNIGYFMFVRGDRTPNTVNLPWFATINNTTLTSSGPLQLGDQVFSSANGQLSDSAGYFSLVGNPYPCSVSFLTLNGSTPGLSNLYNRFYLWNSNLPGTEGVGGYILMDGTVSGHTSSYLNSYTGLYSTTDPNLQIQSGQAFFVQTISTAAASITFQESDKTTGTANNNYIYRPEVDPDSSQEFSDEFFYTGLCSLNSDSSISLIDGTVAQYGNYCNCVDGFDAPKFENADQMISLTRDGKKIGIERRATIINSDTLFLTINNMAQENYLFKLAPTFNHNHPGLGALLEDSYTGTHTPLNLSDTNRINFTVGSNPASSTQNRFMVVFGAVNIAPIYAYIKANRDGNTIPVEWSVSNDSSMTSYALQRSTDGIHYTTIYTTTANHNGNGYNWIDTDPATGTNYYRVLSTDVLNEQSYSPIATVDVASLNPGGITVYPNPIQNNRIGISMNNMAEGTYHYNLLNDLGQQIQTGSFSHPGGNATTSILINYLISKGTYRLAIIEPDNTSTVVNVLY